MMKCWPKACFWRDDWRNCRAKKLLELEQELKSGLIPLSPTGMTAKEAHNQRPEYEEVGIKKFKRNFENLRRAIGKEMNRAFRDTVGLTRDRQLHPVPAYNQQGDRRWEGSDAQRLLRQDMKQNLHKAQQPQELWNTRSEYSHYSLPTFRNHIYKEELRNKRLAKYKTSGSG
jgi:hypothetical protein